MAALVETALGQAEPLVRVLALVGLLVRALAAWLVAPARGRPRRSRFCLVGSRLVVHRSSRSAFPWVMRMSRRLR